MKHLKFPLIAFLILCASFAYSQDTRDILFQASTIKALLDGVYDGDISFGDLMKHGNHGIGTFNHLDGEMVCIDGVFFQIKSDGKIYPVNDNIKTPFAVMTFFEEDISFSTDKNFNLKELYDYLDSRIPSKNLFYAIRIDGTFKYVRTRSVPAQKKPYPPLVEIAKKQPVFEFSDVKGTLIGFFFPEYMKELNVPGYHLHFINDNRTAGGHLLEIHAEKIKIKIDICRELSLLLPETEDFLSIDLSGQKEMDIKMVEK